jgi:hypothetical protein
VFGIWLYDAVGEAVAEVVVNGMRMATDAPPVASVLQVIDCASPYM